MLNLDARSQCLNLTEMPWRSSFNNSKSSDLFKRGMNDWFSISDPTRKMCKPAYCITDILTVYLYKVVDVVFLLLTHVFIESSVACGTFNFTTPTKLARAFILLLDLNGVVPPPATQNPATPVSRSGLFTNSSRGTQRSCLGVRDAIIRGLI